LRQSGILDVHRWAGIFRLDSRDGYLEPIGISGEDKLVDWRMLNENQRAEAGEQNGVNGERDSPVLRLVSRACNLSDGWLRSLVHGSWRWFTVNTGPAQSTLGAESDNTVTSREMLRLRRPNFARFFG
jgi:hypothetical protein